MQTLIFYLKFKESEKKSFLKRSFLNFFSLSIPYTLSKFGHLNSGHPLYMIFKSPHYTIYCNNDRIIKHFKIGNVTLLFFDIELLCILTIIMLLMIILLSLMRVSLVCYLGMENSVVYILIYLLFCPFL